MDKNRFEKGVNCRMVFPNTFNRIVSVVYSNSRWDNSQSSLPFHSQSAISKLIIPCLCCITLLPTWFETQTAFALETALDTTHIAKQQIPDTLLPDVSKSLELPEGILFGSFTKEDGTLYIKGNVVVPSGQSLEFGPGCKIYIGGEYTTITVFGQIIAKGTKDEPVVFMSARNKPNPWDWDRIYCRSKNQSHFEYCIVRHSNYGIVVENGSASIKNSRFERNSLNGLVVHNSNVTISSSVFSGGHATAITIVKGGVVDADSIIVLENNSGIACDSFATFKLNKGIISRNTNGVVVSPKAFVSIVAAEITKNRNGVITTIELPRRTREMVFGNGVDVKIIPVDEISSLIKEPLAIKSIALPKSTTSKSLPENFSAGFTALSAPQEPDVSFIGNVTTGISLYNPTSSAHPIDDSLRLQQKYLGEQSDKWYSGIQPELQIFGNGKRGAVDINLLVDMYGNEWLSTERYIGKNMFNLSLSYSPQSLVFGDFFESGSETSVSGRQMTGIKYSGSYFTMGTGMYHVEVKLAAGESEVPKDVGDRELNIISDTVDTGMSVRQQITYITSMAIKPVKNATVTIRSIIAQDQIDKPLLRETISDIEAPEPIRSQTGCFEGSFDLFDNKVTLYSELDLGSHDTLRGEEKKDVAWYNPHIKYALPEVFKLFNSSKFMDHYAYTGGVKTLYKGFTIDASFMQIGESYFSAGNPYLENDRRSVALSSDNQISERLSTSGSYEYERTNLSETPDDYHSLLLSGEYQMGENKPSFTVSYTLQFNNSPSTERVDMIDTGYTGEFEDQSINNMISIEGKHILPNGIGYSLRYQFMNDNDISDHPDISNNNIGDRFQNQINGWFSFKINRIIKNKSTFRITLKNENRDSLQSIAYKVGNNLNITILPRKLTCIATGEYGVKNDNEYVTDSTGGFWTETINNLYSAELETKYSITPKLSFTLKGRYEKSYDELAASLENYRLYVIGLYSTFLF